MCNVWGYITAFGVGDITRIQGRFTAVRYIQILEELFFPVSGKDFSFPPRGYLYGSRLVLHSSGDNISTVVPPTMPNPLLPCGGLAIY